MTPATVQRLNALERANAIRIRRAQLRRELGSGETDLATVLSDAPDWLESARVGDVLRMVHRVGNSKARKICALSGVTYARTVGELTLRQRNALIDLMPRIA